MSEKVRKIRTEYRIIGRFAKDKKPHVVDYNWEWTLADANRRLNQLIEQEKASKKRGWHTDKVGSLGISTPYYSEYELLDLHIQSREVTIWSNI